MNAWKDPFVPIALAFLALAYAIGFRAGFDYGTTHIDEANAQALRLRSALMACHASRRAGGLDTPTALP